MQRPLKDRFTEKVWETTGCHFWIGGQSDSGYGTISDHGRNRKVNRVAWELANGRPVPERCHVLHHCDNPLCVRPDHLYLGTNQDNVDDRRTRGRSAIGTRHGNAKLDCGKVVEIRASQDTISALARRFRVHRWAVQSVRRGVAWTHCPGTQAAA